MNRKISDSEELRVLFINVNLSWCYLKQEKNTAIHDQYTFADISSSNDEEKVRISTTV
jgi:hypothetical protein